VEPWCTACQDLSVYLPRFHLYADAIVAKGSRIGAGNMYCRIVAFTDGTLIPAASTDFMATNFSASLIQMASFPCMDHSKVRATIGLCFRWPWFPVFVLRTKGGGQYSGIWLFPFRQHCFRMTQQPQNADERAFYRIICIANKWCFNHVQQFFGSIFR